MKRLLFFLTAWTLLPYLLCGPSLAHEGMRSDAGASSAVNGRASFLVSANTVDGALWNKYSNKTAPQKSEGQTPAEKKPESPLSGSPEAAEQKQAPGGESGLTTGEASGTPGPKDSPAPRPYDLELYLDNTQKISQKLQPEFLAYMPENEETLLAKLVFAVEATDVALKIDEKQDILVATCRIPNGAEALRQVSATGTLREHVALFGAKTLAIAEQLGLCAQEARSAPTSVPGIYRLSDLFVATDGDRLLVSNNLARLQEVRTAANTPAEAVPPAGYAVWGRWRTPLATSDAAEPALTITSWAGLNPIDEGWKFAHGSDLHKHLPDVLGQMPPLNAAATAVYGADAPYLALAFSGKFLAAASIFKGVLNDPSMDPFIAMAMDFSQNIDGISLRLGEARCTFQGAVLPGLSVVLTGRNETLDSIAAMLKEGAQTTWIDSAFPNWRTASVSQGNVFELPLPLLVAQKDNTLIMGLMAADSLAVAHKPQDILQKLPQAATLDVPRQFTSIAFHDLKTLWQEWGALLAPGGAMRSLSGMENSFDAETLSLTDQLLQLTPPLLGFISWTNTPQASEGGGYILVQQEGSTEFSKTFARLLTKLLQKEEQKAE